MRVFSTFLWTTGSISILIGGLYLGLFASVSSLHASEPANAKPATIWFKDVALSVPATDEQLTAVTVFVRDRVLRQTVHSNKPGKPVKPDAVGKTDKTGEPKQATTAKASPARGTWPASVKIDSQPRMVFVSISDAITPARVSLGTGKGLMAATEDALAKLQLEAEANKTFEPRWVKVDIVANVFEVPDANLKENLLFDRSLFGLAFSRETNAAVLAEELIANELVDHHQAFSLERFGKYVKQRKPMRICDVNGISPEKSNLIRFNTRSMFADKTETAKLYRGHRMFHKITKKQVIAAATLAKDYMLRSVNRQGRFVFLYHADLNEYEPRHSIGHHYSYIYSLLETYESIKDERLLDAARRALAYGKRSVGSWTKRGQRVYCVLDEKNNVYLRFNSLATLACAKLVKHLGDKATDDERDQLQRFAMSIVTSQRGDGYITLHQTFPDGRIHDDITSVVFYAGEAMVALDEVNKIDPQKKWRDALEKTAKYIINVRDKDRNDNRMIQDPWTLVGMAGMYGLDNNRIYLQHATKTARAIRSRNNIDVRYDDWFGGYAKPPDTMTTALRTYGLGVAYELLRDAKQTTEAKANLETTIRGNAFLLQTQFAPEVAMYYKDPQRTLGAFRESLTVPTVRTDYVQYGLKSLLTLHRIMEADGVDEYDVDRPKKKR